MLKSVRLFIVNNCSTSNRTSRSEYIFKVFGFVLFAICGRGHHSSFVLVTQLLCVKNWLLPSDFNSRLVKKCILAARKVFVEVNCVE